MGADSTETSRYVPVLLLPLTFAVVLPQVVGRGTVEDRRWVSKVRFHLNTDYFINTKSPKNILRCKLWVAKNQWCVGGR
jgi:hypothetical protein